MKRVRVTLRILRVVWIAAVALLAGRVVVDAAAAARDLWYAREAAGDARVLGYLGVANWRMDHGKRCPPDAAAIARHMGVGRTVDPWGTPYQVRCVGDALPRVFSAGPDRVAGTRDDVHPR